MVSLSSVITGIIYYLNMGFPIIQKKPSGFQPMMRYILVFTKQKPKYHDITAEMMPSIITWSSFGQWSFQLSVACSVTYTNGSLSFPTRYFLLK